MNNEIKSIAHSEAGKFEETRFEKIHNVVFNNSKDASVIIAAEIASLIRSKAEKNKNCVIGLATGSSPIRVYEELVRLHTEEGLSFRNVVSFNLDEYFPMEKSDVQSYHHFMHEHLFDHIDILPQNIHIPDGSINPEEIYPYCEQYEKKIEKAGGLDFQLLGIGRTGHIGFNEPGSHHNSGTRIITLDHLTRVDAASAFLGIDNVPRKAITMGISTIKKAKRIVLMAWGVNKAKIIKEAVEGKVSSEIPSTYLQDHPNTTFVLDKQASMELTRIKTPWLTSSFIWTDDLKLKAVLWLSEKLDKSILKLTDKDYNNNGMSELLTVDGPAYDLNIKIFNRMQHTITGWPGGKPGADDTKRPERAIPERKRVIIFSPHPDDDVISMGGTFDRLIEQGHEVHVVYQTSGSNGVSNEEAYKFAEVSYELEKSAKIERILKGIRQKKKQSNKDKEIRKLKSLIRRKESMAAIRYLGLPDERVHFLDLPFYETGSIKKFNVSDEDILLMSAIIEKIKPHQIYAAGDLADPHGTHEICLNVLFLALEKLKPAQFLNDCWVWLYRGAWLEWESYEIDMAVPMSPDQVIKKRHVIFFHQSQKDKVMFQGDDTREFWLRVEERNWSTAHNYRKLGLADYEAMEAFKRYYF